MLKHVTNTYVIINSVFHILWEKMKYLNKLKEYIFGIINDKTCSSFILYLM